MSSSRLEDALEVVGSNIKSLDSKVQLSALQLEALNENLAKTFRNILSLKTAIEESSALVTTGITAARDSFEKTSKSQEKYQLVLCLLTFGLIAATLVQAWVVYWSSKPERTIELIQTIEKFENSQPKIQKSP